MCKDAFVLGKRVDPLSTIPAEAPKKFESADVEISQFLACDLNRQSINDPGFYWKPDARICPEAGVLVSAS
jgi:hypothetical protein